MRQRHRGGALSEQNECPAPAHPPTHPPTHLREEPLGSCQVGGKEVEEQGRVGGQLGAPRLAAPLAAAAPLVGSHAAALCRRIEEGSNRRGGMG